MVANCEFVLPESSREDRYFFLDISQVPASLGMIASDFSHRMLVGCLKYSAYWLIKDMLLQMY